MKQIAYYKIVCNTFFFLFLVIIGQSLTAQTVKTIGLLEIIEL